MKLNRSLLASAWTLPFLIALAAPADRPSFHPAQGLVVTKTFTTQNHLVLEDMQMSMGGQSHPMPEMSMEMDMEQTVEVTDTYSEVSGGKVNKLVRRFDTLSGQGSMSSDVPGMGAQDKDVTIASALEGKTVVFTWNEDAGEYEIAYAGGEGDQALLEGLEEPMDLRALLPKEDVEEGATWEIDVKSLTSVLMPGGNLKLEPEDEEIKQMPGMGGNLSNLSDLLGDSVQGQATGEYRGKRTVDGVEVGVIGLKIEIKSSSDMTEQVRENMQNLPPGMPKMEVDHVDVDLELTGEGTLYWDLAAGIVHSFEFAGTARTVVDTGMSIEQGEGTMEFEQTMEMSGTFGSKLATSKG